MADDKIEELEKPTKATEALDKKIFEAVSSATKNAPEFKGNKDVLYTAARDVAREKGFDAGILELERLIREGSKGEEEEDT